MSLDLVAKPETEAVKKDNLSTSTKTESKKEGSSLFDSIMSDVKKEQSKSDKENKNSDNKTKIEQNNIQNKSSKDIKNKTQEDGESKTPVKKMVDKLVDVVVDEAKAKKALKKEDTELDSKKQKNTTDVLKEEKSESKQEVDTKKIVDIKSEVQSKTQTIKEAVEDIKKEVSKIVKEDVNEKESDPKKEIKDSKNIDQKEKSQDQDIKSKVEIKTQSIKEAVEDIKKEVSKIAKEEVSELKDSKNTKVKEEKSQNEDIKSKVETKTQTIKEAVEDIKKEVSKVANDELKNENNKSEIKEIKSNVDAKAEIIKDSAQEIKQDVAKVIVTSDPKKIGLNQNESKKVKSDELLDKQNSSKIINTEESETKSDSKVDNKSSFMANGFLNSQKTLKQNVSMTQIKDAKDNIEENKTLKSVKESAKMLELNPNSEMEVESTGEKGESKLELLTKQRKENLANFSQNQALNKILINKQNIADTVEKQVEQNIQKATNSANESLIIKEKEINVTLNVPQTVVETIQSKIVGAHQRVGSFMSEVARNMYLNYKPPLTSFRMNLNPANLGSISIVMRANKVDNAINVSMNMNNTTTMEAFSENRAALQTALQRQLGEGSNISLNFGMQDGNSNNQFEGESNQKDSNQRGDTQASKEAINNTEEPQEVLEETNYM